MPTHEQLVGDLIERARAHFAEELDKEGEAGSRARLSFAVIEAWHRAHAKERDRGVRDDVTYTLVPSAAAKLLVTIIAQIIVQGRSNGAPAGLDDHMKMTFDMLKLLERQVVIGVLEVIAGADTNVFSSHYKPADLNAH